mmetsp:Transcript_12951/g.26264  ORF Transcript_12951/g.26264 Transcript_12951/m.26264 type:complete len:168 (-) Transcript_12951:1136-1639(-)
MASSVSGSITGSSSSLFTFPAFHGFAPSFTRQPVMATLSRQSTLWCDLIRNYCRHHRVFWLDVTEASGSPLFCNEAIQRRLSLEDIRFFLGELVNRGEGEWSTQKDRCLVYWRTPEEWGDVIYSWVDATGRNNTPLTVYEIRHGQGSAGQGEWVAPLQVFRTARLPP